MRAGQGKSITVPVALNRLGVEGGDNAMFLAEQVQQVACKVHLISYFQSAHWSYLELPLPRHYFSVDARNDDARLQQCGFF